MSSPDDAASPPGGERARGLVVGVEGGHPSRPRQAIRHDTAEQDLRGESRARKTLRLACLPLQCSEGRVVGIMANPMVQVWSKLTAGPVSQF